MKIGVCIKQVPDTASKIRIKPDQTGIVEDNMKFVVGPYDEYAIEEALRTKEKQTDSEVVVLTVGPKRSQEALRSALAMGVDRAIHLNTEGEGPVDSLVVARLLAAKIKKEGLGLVFTGRVATDEDNAQVSQMMAELLGWPQVTVVSKFSLNEDASKADVERDIEGGAKEVWEVDLPAVIAVTKGINEPRYASLKGIMAAKKKPLAEVTLADSSVSKEDLVAKIESSNFQSPPQRAAGKIFKDDPSAAVSEVVRLLREEAKVL